MALRLKLGRRIRALRSGATRPLGLRPRIQTINPVRGPAAGGTTVILTGINFADVTHVDFGGTSVAFTVVGDNQITVTSPAGTAGTAVSITLTNPEGTGSIRFLYEPEPVPTVTSLSPNNGPPAGGTTVTINGTNFTAGSAVMFGATPASSVTFVSVTQLTAVSPAGAAGMVNVRVTTPIGTSAIAAANRFTYAVLLSAFWGGTTDWITPTGAGASVPVTIVDAAYVTGLSYSMPNPVNGSALVLDVVAGHRNTMFAYPATLQPASSIFQQGLGMDIKTAFTQLTIPIDGVNYRVYYVSTEFPFPVAGERFTLTI